MKEKYIDKAENITIEYVENKKKSVGKQVSLQESFRVHKDGKVGIHHNIGPISDEEGYKKAENNLVRERPYPFGLETGVRHRDMTEQKLTDKELIDISGDCMDYLLKNHPDYIYNANFSQQTEFKGMTNEKGLDYSNNDCCVNIFIGFKHKDSKDISDGSFSFSLRKYDHSVFTRMADDYLTNFQKIVDIPDEIIIDEQYYGKVGKLVNELNGESLALKTSLLTGKIGEKVFSDDLTVWHDVSDKETWFNTFYDGDGITFENDRFLLIEKGKLITGIADKRDAKKYNIPHTGPAYTNFSDIPGTGSVNARLERSGKTIKELLNGRYAVIPVMAYGGGFNEKGDYTMPIHSSLLFDGEKILGKLPPFTAISNFFDMFGKDFIGVGTDQPVYNDKQLLYRVNKGELK